MSYHEDDCHDKGKGETKRKEIPFGFCEKCKNQK